MKYSVLVQGKTFAGIFLLSGFFMLSFFYPEAFGGSYASLIPVNDSVKELANIPFLQNILTLALFAISTIGVSLIIMTMFLKIDANHRLKNSQRDAKIWSVIQDIPSIAIVETLTFCWVLCWLGLSVILIINIFRGNLELLSVYSEMDPATIMNVSFVCGMLGGSLANINFFLPSKNPKIFNLAYVYKYIANPFFSSVIAFLSYLAFMNLNWFGLNSNYTTSINLLSLIFVFTLVGYFSEHFIALMYSFVRKLTTWLEHSFDLQLSGKLKKTL